METYPIDFNYAMQLGKIIIPLFKYLNKLLASVNLFSGHEEEVFIFHIVAAEINWYSTFKVYNIVFDIKVNSINTCLLSFMSSCIYSLKLYYYQTLY